MTSLRDPRLAVRGRVLGRYSPIEVGIDSLIDGCSFGDWRPISQGDSVPDPSVSDGIPWPAITKMAPSKLNRTASSLMTEWERSLSPDRTPASPTLSEKENKAD